jgi:hypothetical protein
MHSLSFSLSFYSSLRALLIKILEQIKLNSKVYYADSCSSLVCMQISKIKIPLYHMLREGKGDRTHRQIESRAIHMEAISQRGVLTC